MRRAGYIAGFACALGFASIGFADEVVLANGDRLRGCIRVVTPSHVEVSTSYARSISVDRTQVVSLETSEDVVVELASGEQLVGTVLLEADKVAVIKSRLLGEQKVATETIRGIHRLAQADADVRGKGTSGTQSKENGKEISIRPIGPKPEDEEDIRKLFLRQASALLRRGEVEVELDLTYRRHSQQLLGVSRYTTRELSLPVSVRFGFCERAEAYLQFPLSYGDQEQTFAGTHDRTSAVGLGDISAGLNYLIVRETADRPDVIVSVGFSAPSGRDPYEGDGSGVAFGTGHWSVSPGVLLVKTFDPVVVFGGLAYTHQFERNGLGQDIQPGETISYNFGMGFGINDAISLSAQLRGAFQTETQVDGSSVRGSTMEPVSLRLALTNRWRKDFYVEPSVELGLNADASDFILGVAAVWRFGGK